MCDPSGHREGEEPPPEDERFQEFDQIEQQKAINDKKAYFANELISLLNDSTKVAQMAEVLLPQHHAIQLRQERIEADDAISVARRHLEQETIEEVSFQDLEHINEIIYDLTQKILELAPHTTNLWTEPVKSIRTDVHEILRSVDKALDDIEDFARAVLGPDLEKQHLYFNRYFAIYGELVS